MKSALRDWLSVSYGMISILLTGSLRSPPPIRAAPDFPLCRGQNKTPRNTLFINGSTVSTGYCATACGGKVVAPATKGGIFLARQGGCMVFAAKGGIKMAPKAPYLPSGAVLHTSRGREPGARPGGVSRSRTEPLAPRARGPAAPSTLTPVRACQPSGLQLPADSSQNPWFSLPRQRLCITSRISLRRLLFPLLLLFFPLS